MTTPRLDAARKQVAVVRALADELDFLMPRGGAESELSEQLVEELTRLGCQVLEGAAALAVTIEAREAGVPGVAPNRHELQSRLAASGLSVVSDLSVPMLSEFRVRPGPHRARSSADQGELDGEVRHAEREG